MRKSRRSMNWPCRDPQRYRFPVPNEVWRYKLRPTEFMILSYLCYHKMHRQAAMLSPEKISNAVHLSVVTVEKHLAALKDNGVLQRESVPGKFFSLPNEIFLFALPSSVFVVYAYLLCCEDRHTHRCYPSYRTISRMTGLSLNTVMKAVGVLVDKRFISVESSHWFNKQGLKRNGNNIYTILPIQFAVDAFHQQQLSRAGCPARAETKKVLDKAVTSPRTSPSRNAGRLKGFRA